MAKLSALVPVNLEEEKEKFFFDTKYNPQFKYSSNINSDFLEKNSIASDEFLNIAEGIMETVIRKYGTEENYISQDGALLSQEKVENIIRQYLQNENLEKSVNLSFSENYLARTSILFSGGSFRLQIRLPIEYREHNIIPVLNHEIGTHAFRWLNEVRQPWFGRHQDFDLAEYLETEEGLAVLNYTSAHSSPYLWMPSLYYYSAFNAQYLSFADLAKKLRKFISNKERLWKTCVRVKRGLHDTSIPGSFTKDQSYLAGAVRVAKWLEENKFDISRLYIGKISIVDIHRIQNSFSLENPRIPSFIKDPDYLKKLKFVISQNQFKV